MTPSPCRIAILSGSFPPLGGGGIASSHFNLCRALKEKGYKVAVFTFREGGMRHPSDRDILRGGLSPALRKGIDALLLALLRASGHKGMFWQFPGALTGAMGGYLAWRRIRRFNPHILIMPDHGAPGALIPKKEGMIRILISHHNPARFTKTDFGEPVSEKDAPLAVMLERHTLKKTDGVVCPSEYMLKTFRETYAYSGPLKVIPNIVDARLIESAEKAPLHEDAGLPSHAPIVYIPSGGSLFKGRGALVEIIKDLSENYGREIGFYLSGQVSEEIKGALSALPGKARFIMPGKTAYGENISNIKGCNLCVSPTLHESFGMAILEAQLCGLPAVVYDVGSTGEIVHDGETGRLVPPGDAKALAKEAARLLKEAPLRDTMSEKAKKHAREKFDAESTVKSFIGFMENLHGVKDD